MSTVALSAPSSVRWSPVSTLGEVMKAHVALAAFTFVVGLALVHLAAVELVPGLSTLLQGNGTIQISSDHREFAFILRTNLLFFLLVSVLPVVNLLLVLPQFFMLGVTTGAMLNLPFNSQFDLLYRHASLEAVALLVSVALSYRMLFALRRFTDSPQRDLPVLGRDLRRLLPGYLLILAITLVAAILEGTAVVGV